MKLILQKLFLLSLILPAGLFSMAQGTKALTVNDMMKFRQIQSPAISPDGQWVLLTARPDRGDPEVQVTSGDGKTFFCLERAEKPAISGDGNWVAAVFTAGALEALNAEKGKAPLPGIHLLNTKSGERETRDSVQSFVFSNNSLFLAMHRAGKSSSNDDSGQEKSGSTLTLKSLDDGKEYAYPFVSSYAMDSVSQHLAMAISDSSGLGNAVHMLDLKNPSADPVIIIQDSSLWVANLTWNNQTGQLVFLSGISEKKMEKKDAVLRLWSPGNKSSEVLLEDKDLKEDWKLYHTNSLRWSPDGSRLFLGTKPESEIISQKEDKDSVTNLYDQEEILADARGGCMALERSPDQQSAEKTMEA